MFSVGCEPGVPSALIRYTAMALLMDIFVVALSLTHSSHMPFQMRSRIQRSKGGFRL